MTVIFLCASIEPGADGVGDYSRKLAASIIGKGHKASIIALNDRHITETAEEIQHYCDVAVPVLRLPSILKYSKAFGIASGFIKENKPDWLSLQFVPFGFQIKGLPVDFVLNIKKIAKAGKWHIMFHEIWMGHASKISSSLFWYGKVQELLTRILIRILKPSAITTQSYYYQFILQKAGINAGILPLFGNIPVTEISGDHFVAENVDAENLLANTTYHKAVVFGSVYNDWYPHEFLTSWDAYLSEKDKTGVVFFVGRPGCKIEDVIIAWSRGLKNIRFISIGKLEEGKVSQYLQMADFGLNPTPIAIIQKSGSAAAMIEHGLPVVTTKIGNIDQNYKVPDLRPSIFLSSQMALSDFNHLKRINNRPADSPVPAKFLQIISKIDA